MQTWVCSCFCCLVYMWSFKAQNLEPIIKWKPFELTWSIKDNLKKPDFSEAVVIKAVVYSGKIMILKSFRSRYILSYIKSLMDMF